MPTFREFRLFLLVLAAVSCIVTASLAFLFSRVGDDRRLALDQHAARSYPSARELHTPRPETRSDRASTTGTNAHHSDSPVLISNHTEDVVHEKRIRHLKEACKAVMTTKRSRNTTAEPPTPAGLLARGAEKGFFVSPVHRLVYCSVEKVGSSFWKRAFRVLNSVEPPKSLFLQSGLSSHRNNENITFENKGAQWQRHQLSRSFKFIFVRDPFARTFSAYMDKIFLPFGAGVVLLHNETASPEASGYDEQNAKNSSTRCRLKVPTFARFIRSAVSPTASLFTFEPHFTPMTAHCSPCSVTFDLVGKMESFRRDAEYILGKVGVRLSDVADDPGTFDVRSDLSIMGDVAWRTLQSPAWRQMASHRRCCARARHELLRRLWTTFQVRGLLSATARYPLAAQQSSAATMSDLLLAIKGGYEAWGAGGRRRRGLQQRERAMAEAFGSVEVGDLGRLGAVLREDCALFGYDCSPGRFLARAPNGSSLPLLPDYHFFKDWR